MGKTVDVSNTCPMSPAKLSKGGRPVVAVRYPVWSSYCPQVLEGVVAHMREGEIWQLVTGNSSYGEMKPVVLDAGWKGDGIILFRATEEELESFRKRRVAAVLTSTEGPDGGFPRVVPDNFLIGRRAAAHLLSALSGSLRFSHEARRFIAKRNLPRASVVMPGSASKDFAMN